MKEKYFLFMILYWGLKGVLKLFSHHTFFENRQSLSYISKLSRVPLILILDDLSLSLKHHMLGVPHRVLQSAQCGT
jgi:hypothetical protein